MRLLDPATEHAARAFLAAIAPVYPLLGGLVFGSRARGEHSPESDADIAVLLAGAQGSTIHTMLAMVEAAYGVELESGIALSPLPIWQEQWDHPERFSNPRLLRIIQQEGVRL